MVWKTEMAHSSGQLGLVKPTAGRRARRPPEECAMAEHTRTERRLHDGRPGSLGQLIHAAVRRAIEVSVDEELTAAFGARPHECDGGRGGYRNRTKACRL
jgi:hypothetical protein